MKILIERKLGFEFITKSKPDKKVVNLIQDYPFAFGQFTITSNDEEYREIFEAGTVLYEKRFEAMKNFHDFFISFLLHYKLEHSLSTIR